MKKAILLSIVASLAIVAGYTVFARAQMGAQEGDKGMMMMQKPGPAGQMNMCPMHMAMMQSMMQKMMVPTPDGGAIILMGDQLLKYDNQLNMVKETKVNVNTQQMQDMMQKMMEQCRKMMQQMQQQQQGGDGKNQQQQ